MVQRYNGPGNGEDDATAIALDGSGNVYVTGSSTGSGTSFDYATIKYNSSGVQQWLQRYNGPGNGDDRANAIAVDTSGNVYVTGKSDGGGTGIDYATIKYSQTIGIKQISSIIPKEFSLLQNYPNPFNPSTKFKIQISKLSDSRVTIYDLLGREVEILVNEQLKPGSYEVDWNASNFTSGLYFYKLTAGDFADTKKMILVK